MNSRKHEETKLLNLAVCSEDIEKGVRMKMKKRRATEELRFFRNESFVKSFVVAVGERNSLVASNSNTNSPIDHFPDKGI